MNTNSNTSSYLKNIACNQRVSNNGLVTGLEGMRTLTRDDRIDGRKYSASEMLKGIMEVTTLSEAYFSEKNRKQLVNMVRYEVYKQSSKERKEGGYVIDTPSMDDLSIIMRSVYLQEGMNRKEGIKEQIRILNRYVVQEAVKYILPEVQMYETYLRDISEMPEPMYQPRNVSIKGTKTLQPSRVLIM